MQAYTFVTTDSNISKSEIDQHKAHCAKLTPRYFPISSHPSHPDIDSLFVLGH